MSKHPIVHVEIPVADRETGSQFYADLFGWKLQHIPEMGYTLFEAEGGPGGGFYSPNGGPGGQEESGSQSVLIHVQTDDVDASLKRVEELGGTAVETMDIPGIGRVGIFTDPYGNRLGLFQPVQGQSA